MLRDGIQVQLLLIPKSNFFRQRTVAAVYVYIGNINEHPVAVILKELTMLNKYLASLKKKKKVKTRQSAESLTPRSPREVIINSWGRHHEAPLEKPEEMQEGTGFGKEKEN